MIENKNKPNIYDNVFFEQNEIEEDFEDTMDEFLEGDININVDDNSETKSSYSIMLKKAMANRGKYKKNEEIIAEIQKIKETPGGDIYKLKQLENEIIENNLLLIHKIIQTLGLNNSPDEDKADFMQQGCMGLLKAIERYNLEQGKFATYAVWWIRQSITRFAIECNKTVRLPVHIYDELFKIKKVIKELQQNGYSEKQAYMAYKEIAEKVDMNKDKVEFVINSFGMFDNIDTLDKKIGEDEDTCLADFVSSDERLEEDVINQFFRDTITENLLSGLSKKQRDIVEYRFGFKDGIAHTLEEVGQIYGVTRERIRQIESKAIQKMKLNAKKQRLDRKDIFDR